VRMPWRHDCRYIQSINTCRLWQTLGASSIIADCVSRHHANRQLASCMTSNTRPHITDDRLCKRPCFSLRHLHYTQGLRRMHAKDSCVATPPTPDKHSCILLYQQHNRLAPCRL
jgi:hypothetical protein